MNTQLNITELRDRELANSHSCYNVHDHLKSMSIEELQSVSKEDRLPWHAACLNVVGDLNIGTMIRTSHCLGASSVTIFGRRRIDNRSLVGSANYITVNKVPGLDNNSMIDAEGFADFLLQNSFTPIFVECNGIPLHKVNWSIRISEMFRRNTQPCLIMGNETGGIPDSVMSLVNVFSNSFVVSIPQRGVIRSLNVAVAHGIVASSMCSEMNWLG